MSSFLNIIRRKFSNPTYIQIWEHRLRVCAINSNEVFDEKPLIAIETSSKGKKIVKEIGNKAEFISDPNIQIINPFSHPRSLIADFEFAEKILQQTFYLLYKNLLIRPAPEVIIHPMEKIEGGLTQIELRVYRELLLSAGACKGYLHMGPPLITSGIEFSTIIEGMEKLF